MKYVPESDFEYAFVTMMNNLYSTCIVLSCCHHLRGMTPDETWKILRLTRSLKKTKQRNVLVG